MLALITAYFESSGSRFLGMLLAHVRISLIALAIAVIYMIPPVLLFLYSEDYLIDGISYSASVKG